jgi:hypothetical protein
MGKDVSSLVIVECCDSQYGYDWLETVKNYVRALTASKTYGTSLPTEVYGKNGQEDTFSFELSSRDERVFASVVLNSRAKGVHDFVSMTTGRKYVVLSQSTDNPDVGFLIFGNVLGDPFIYVSIEEDKSLEDYKDLVMEKFIEKLS